MLQIYFSTLTSCIHAPSCTLDRHACPCVALRPSAWNMYIIDTYTYVKCQSKSIRRRARVRVNTILGVASSPNYYFTRRSYTRWYECWVAVGPYSFLSRYNCRVGMSRRDPAQSRMSRTARFISRRMSTFRYFDECYSAQVKTIDSRRAFNEGEREREELLFWKENANIKKKWLLYVDDER